MKKTAIAIAMMTLVLIGTTLAQPQRRVAQSTALGGGSGVGIKNRRTANLGDTGTHEVGHKGKRRNVQANTGDGTTQHFRTKAPKGPASLTNTVAYDFRDDKGKGNNAAQGARTAVPAPTPSPATVRKGGPKTTNFSWGATQTGQFRTKQPRRP